MASALAGIAGNRARLVDGGDTGVATEGAKDGLLASTGAHQ